MSRSRTLVAALATAAALGGGLFASPAQAEGTSEIIGVVDVGDTQYTSFAGPVGRGIALTPFLQRGLANGNNTRQVTFECAANATGDALSTGFTDCSLRYTVNGVLKVVQANKVALPGPFNAAAQFTLQVPMGVSATVCGTARTTWLDGTIGTSGQKCLSRSVVI